jgi:oligoendopeptidase F
MKAFVKPTIGSWDLGDLVKEPHGHEFKKFLETTKKNLIEFESKKNDPNDGISAFSFENLLHMIEDITQKVSIANGYAHLRYAADTSSNEAASFVTRWIC